MKECCKQKELKKQSTIKPVLDKKVRRKKIFISLAILSTIIISFALGMATNHIIFYQDLTEKANAQENIYNQKNLTELYEQVLPHEGFQSKIRLDDAIIKLEKVGAIDKEKFIEIYEKRGGLSPDLASLLDSPSDQPITINKENAQFFVNLLWPLGLTNKSQTLTESRAALPENINVLAATGGWTLGKESGPSYYNAHEIIHLSPKQQQLVKDIAENIFRPCCGNHTAFPDCNHGAAMLGLLQLGVAQGLSEQELYEEALKFNAFWFPDNYSKMAFMFKYMEDKDYKNLDPKLLLSEQYSSGIGYRENVINPLSQIPGALPQTSGGGGCSA